MAQHWGVVAADLAAVRSSRYSSPYYGPALDAPEPAAFGTTGSRYSSPYYGPARAPPKKEIPMTISSRYSSPYYGPALPDADVRSNPLV